MPKPESMQASSEDAKPTAESTESPEESSEARRRRISLAAYYRALGRGFLPGGELEDWYAAEAEERERKGNALDNS
jgi:DUF2934 family protein